MTNSAYPNQLKSADLELHCLQRQGIFGFNRTIVKSPVIIAAEDTLIFVLFFVFVRGKKGLILYENVCIVCLADSLHEM